MKKGVKILIGVIITLIILWGIVFAIDYLRCRNFKMPIFVVAGETADDGGSGIYHGLGYKVNVEKSISAEYGVQLEKVEMYFLNKVVAASIADAESNIVEIKNGNINNENLIENFINKVSDNSNKEEVILLIKEYQSDDEYIEKELKFTPGNLLTMQMEDGSTIVEVPSDPAEYKEKYGYFTLIVNEDVNNAETFDAFYWKLSRRVENDNVIFGFATNALIEVNGFPEICRYNLDSSNYTKNFEMHYYHKEDKKAKLIVDKNINNEFDYDIYTYDGTVSFTFGTDIVYTFEEALKQKVITIEEILEQAKIDLKYGICDEGYFSDGGSTEYRYGDYTILKYNTLDGNKDLVIGPVGQIINEVNDNLYSKSLSDN